MEEPLRDFLTDISANYKIDKYHSKNATQKPVRKNVILRTGFILVKFCKLEVISLFHLFYNFYWLSQP